MDLGKLAGLAEHRQCKVCGAEFFSGKDATALEQFSDHLIKHNPTPEQWANAYRTIQREKEEPSKEVHPVNEELLESIRANKRAI